VQKALPVCHQVAQAGFAFGRREDGFTGAFIDELGTAR